MIICQTPFRISFFGGGTDYPLWYKEHGGAVISTAINKYGYISCRRLPPFFTHKHRLVYSNIELVNEISEIEHPAVKAVFKYLNVTDGLEIHYDGDLPANSGIGSSSSFTVGLLNTLYALHGNMKTKKFLAEQTIHIEQNLIKETVGSQDQIAAAFGGFNRINFYPNGQFEVQPIKISPERIDKFKGKLLLFFTGFSRIAEAVAKSQIENIKNNEAPLLRMREMVDEAQDVFQSSTSDFDDIGRMLHEAWLLKRELSQKISNPEINEIYEIGRKHGGLGGKILGAGGGGFFLFYAPEESHQRIRGALSHLIEVDFDFDFGGSKIILHNPQLATTQTSSKMIRNLNPYHSPKGLPLEKLELS